MTHPNPVIAWFRQDLRLADNPMLAAAAASGGPVIPVYILDDNNAGDWAMGGASRWWLHRSLAALNDSLDGNLCVFHGNAETILPALVEEIDATAVYWNRCYEPWRIDRDRQIMTQIRDAGRTAQSFGGSFLFEPQSVTKNDGTPYRVFTPYFRKGCLQGAPAPRKPLAAPTGLTVHRPAEWKQRLDDLALLPAIHWFTGLEDRWTPGEAGADARLGQFVSEGIHCYEEGRNRPDKRCVSRLSPHLHFGELSPHQAWHAATHSGAAENDVDRFRSELGWREFSTYLLYHFPSLPTDNLQSRFDRFPWRDDETALCAWQRGLTGYPIVDAGMRELWQTGYMHNRVRMIVGSFLVKNLLLHWHHGERWFWDTLVDADLANNSASWQWIAGCGADAAPYFRIFNPVLQGKKFDPDGVYVKQHIPELEKLPPKFIHTPWEAPDDVLASADVRIDDTYPAPIVNLKASRERALAAFQSLRARSD